MSLLNGKWSGEGVEMEFASDGTVKVTVLERINIYKYRFLDDNTIEIAIPGISKAEQIYEIDFNDDVLTLYQSGIPRAYKRLVKPS